MKEMEAELSQLKRMYANLALENQAIKDLIEKNFKATAKTQGCSIHDENKGLSISCSCGCVGLSMSAFYRPPLDPIQRDQEVIRALHLLVAEFPRLGFWKYAQILSARGYPWNAKRIYRVYCALGLNQPRRTKRRPPKRNPLPLVTPQKANQVWSADFLSDSLYRGPRLRLFCVLDDYNREALAIEVDTSLRSARLVRVFERLKETRGLPGVLRTDNGPEFLGAVFVDWCKANGICLAYIQPGKPTQNAFVERFNRSLRNEVLNLYLFRNLEQVREQVDLWKTQYNEQRPHDALGRIPPRVYAARKLENSSFKLST